MAEMNNAQPHKERAEDKVTFQMAKHTVWQIVAGIFAVLFVVSLVTGGFGLKSDTPTGSVIVDPQGNQPTVEQRVKVSVDDDASMGDKDAPVTIIEFSDYQCPFCGKFYTQTLPSIQSQYIDTGKVKLVYRDFPLSFHPQAQKAAEAAECAGDQDKYFEMHDKIFANQALLSDTIFSTWAQELGLNVEEFDACLSSGKHTKEIGKDLTDGTAAGVTGTPSFFIGNDKEGYVQIGGAQPFSVFQQTIEAELA